MDFGHRATIQFALTQMPGGSATISSDTVSTDALGVATVALSAGTLAQAVLVRAQVLGTAIYSEQVSVAIHGGPPNAAHLSFAVEKVNVPGLVEFGIIDRVTAFVGDRYGNPVAPGNVVYFTTTGGIIQGSSSTDDHGRAAVDLVTAAPLPNDVPARSRTAPAWPASASRRLDENRTPIVRSGLAVMFSGHTELSVSPTTSFDIPAGGAQDFVVTVRDIEHHNPLTGGTTVSFSASAGTVGGGSSFTLPDTRDPRFTSFTFRLENNATGLVIVGPDRHRVALGGANERRDAARIAVASAGAIEASPRGATPERSATVTVTVTSRNGDARAVVPGTLQ